MTGTARSQLQLRQAFVFTDSCPLPQPEVLVTRAGEEFDSSGRLTGQPTRDMVRNLLDALAARTAAAQTRSTRPGMTAATGQAWLVMASARIYKISTFTRGASSRTSTPL